MCEAKYAAFSGRDLAMVQIVHDDLVQNAMASILHNDIIQTSLITIKRGYENIVADVPEPNGDSQGGNLLVNWM